MSSDVGERAKKKNPRVLAGGEHRHSALPFEKGGENLREHVLDMQGLPVKMFQGVAKVSVNGHCLFEGQAAILRGD